MKTISRDFIQDLTEVLNLANPPSTNTNHINIKNKVIYNNFAMLKRVSTQLVHGRICGGWHLFIFTNSLEMFGNWKD